MSTQKQPAEPAKAAESEEQRSANPFDNNRRVDDELQEAGEELEKEQQFKEAQRERD